tara:strand:+ start:4888 stop:5289 length:402 start_codon:yes stop_codon:yes gene_type:complete
MSAISLGDTAIVVDLEATDIRYKNERRKIVSDITAPGALPTRGFHILAPAANPTAFTIPDGVAKGDVVEFLHKTGGNVANITPSDLHGGITAVAMTGGSYSKFIWTGTQWYIIARCGDGAAAGNAVLNYPVLS